MAGLCINIGNSYKQSDLAASREKEREMKTIETTVYEFDELSDKAKETARDWWRDGRLYDNWWEHIYEDAATIGLTITEFDLDRYRAAKGKFNNSLAHVFDLITLHHGTDTETYKTAETYKALYDAIPVDEDGEKDSDHVEEVEEDFLQSLLEDYSIRLDKEYEYLMSDDYIDETIRINEYTFTIDGKRR